SITKGIYGIIGDIQIIRPEFLEPMAFQRSAGILMVIIKRHLSYILWPGRSQLATRIDIPEQHIGDSMTGFRTTEPDIQDGRDLIVLPFDSQGASGKQH